PELYTPSLHDALPICVALLLSACGASKSTTDEYANSSRLDTSTVTANLDNTNRPLAACNQRSNTQIGIALAIYKSGEVIANNKIDRKSTRLNSSHVKI